jgi:hypothetical protein
MPKEPLTHSVLEIRGQFQKRIFKFIQVKLSLVNQAIEGNLNNKLMVDKDVETPTHFIEKNLDPNYHWNEW